MTGLFQTPENPHFENYAVHLIDPQSASAPFDPTSGTQTDHADGDGTMIGVVGTLGSNTDPDSTSPPVANLGYIFHPSSWGKGFATEAIMAFMVRFWTLKPTFQAIQADVDSRNLASIRVLQKCGFAQVETIKRGGRKLPLMDIDEEPGDLVVFRIEKPEKI